MDGRKLRQAVVWVVINQTVVGVPFMYASFVVMKWRGCSFGRELPTFHWVVFELVIFTLIEELVFYYSHRYTHTHACVRMFNGPLFRTKCLLCFDDVGWATGWASGL